MIKHLAAAVLCSSAAIAADPFDVIAFGSCAREREPQPIWTEILAKRPDLFLFIGDNQYADLWFKDGRMVMEPVEDPERIREAYAELAAKPGFRRMRRACPIMATWDDHDYGANDGGREFALRDESQDIFLDFFGFRDSAPIRDQEGIYHARFFEGPGGERVQVIMLDTRYHRGPLDRAEERPRGRGPYVPAADRSSTLLGAAQWEWLGDQLAMDADVRVIASSIQVVADEHGWETWGNLPHERARLYDLIDATGAEGVVFVSGDRHLMEISRDASGAAPYPIWDFTSSGLTQDASPVDEPNAHRVGPVVRETNFGIIRFAWGGAERDTAIHLEGYGDQGQLLTRQTVWLSELSGD